MIKTCAGLGLLLTLSALCAQKAVAQQYTLVEIEPKTKLEALNTQIGVVLIRGFSHIGTIASSPPVEINAIEITDTSTGKKQTGMTIEVKGAARFDNTDRSFVDNDEIDALLTGIDYISKSNADFTKLDHFVAIYKTKGYFRASTFSIPGNVNAAISIGYTKPTIVSLSMQQLTELKSLIVRAKQKLDLIN
jgi:hypothetical protein